MSQAAALPLPGLAAAPQAAAQRKPVNKWLVTLSVTFGTLMGALDSSIVSVAVPHLRGAVGATVEEITWITTGFVIANVLVMPLTAFLGRMFGQKRVYMAALALFVVGSGLCGLARSLTTLVVFRLVQGLGAGALQPTEQAILRQTFPPKEQGMAMAVFGMAVILGPAFGPTLGGFIVDNYTWPWIFYINLPIGVFALFMVQKFVHEPDDIRAANIAMAEQQRKHMDWAGIALLAVGISTLQYVLEEGTRDDWFQSRTITVCAVLAVVTLAAFVIRELTATVPAVNLSLFTDKVFLSGTVVGGIMFAMLMSISFLLPVFMQEILGFTAMQSGLALMPRSLAMMLCMPIVGKLYNRVSARATVAFGIVVYAISAFFMSHYNLNTTAGDVVAVLLMQGVAFSCLFIPLTTVALAGVPRQKLADGTGLNSLVRQIGGSLGLAVFASLMPRFAKQATASLSAHVTQDRPEVMARLGGIANMLVGKGYDAASAQIAAKRMLGGMVAREAMVLTFEKLFLLSGILFLAIIPVLYFLKAPDDPDAVVADVHVEM